MAEWLFPPWCCAPSGPCCHQQSRQGPCCRRLMTCINTTRRMACIVVKLSMTSAAAAVDTYRHWQQQQGQSDQYVLFVPAAKGVGEQTKLLMTCRALNCALLALCSSGTTRIHFPTRRDTRTGVSVLLIHLATLGSVAKLTPPQSSTAH